MKLLVVLLAGVALAVTGCGSDDPSTVADSPASTTTTTEAAGEGTVAVSLEPTEGRFIEGFEVGLRFETTDGEVIDKTLWTDFVQSLGPTDSLDVFYDSVLEQPVPAGDVVVLASVAIGMGPGPVAPDLDGDLDCRLPVTVPADGRVEVEVSFDSSTGDCLTVK